MICDGVGNRHVCPDGSLRNVAFRTTQSGIFVTIATPERMRTGSYVKRPHTGATDEFCRFVALTATPLRSLDA
jgi:hypothetical protein